MLHLIQKRNCFRKRVSLELLKALPGGAFQLVLLHGDAVRAACLGPVRGHASHQYRFYLVSSHMGAIYPSDSVITSTAGSCNTAHAVWGWMHSLKRHHGKEVALAEQGCVCLTNGNHSTTLCSNASLLQHLCISPRVNMAGESGGHGRDGITAQQLFWSIVWILTSLSAASAMSSRAMARPCGGRHGALKLQLVNRAPRTSQLRAENDTVDTHGWHLPDALPCG